MNESDLQDALYWVFMDIEGFFLSSIFGALVGAFVSPAYQDWRGQRKNKL